MPLWNLLPQPWSETMMSWKSDMFRTPWLKFASPHGDLKLQIPDGTMAMMMVKSPAPALQSETCTSTWAGQLGEMTFLLRVMAQMFSSLAPHPLLASVGVAVGCPGVGVLVGGPGVLVGTTAQDGSRAQVTVKIPWVW